CIVLPAETSIYASTKRYLEKANRYSIKTLWVSRSMRFTTPMFRIRIGVFAALLLTIPALHPDEPHESENPAPPISIAPAPAKAVSTRSSSSKAASTPKVSQPVAAGSPAVATSQAVQSAPLAPAKLGAPDSTLDPTVGLAEKSDGWWSA